MFAGKSPRSIEGERGEEREGRAERRNVGVGDFHDFGWEAEASGGFGWDPVQIDALWFFLPRLFHLRRLVSCTTILFENDRESNKSSTILEHTS